MKNNSSSSFAAAPLNEASGMKNSVRTVGSIFFIILFSKVLGQIREMMLANYYGTGSEATAFVTATQIPLSFFDIILGMAIVSAFVPVFNEYYLKDGLPAANAFANHFIGVIIIISAVISVLGVVFSGFVISLIGIGLEADTALLASRLLKIMFPSIIFTSIAYAFAGILQSFGEFKVPAAMSVISNGVTILYLLLFSNKLGIYGLTWSMLAGWVLQLVVLVPFLVKFRFRFGFCANFLHPGMKKVYKLALPILLSSWVQPLNVMINMALASFLNEGQAVSAINYANRLYLIIASVFTVAVTNLILPSLSRLHTAGKKQESGIIINNSLKSVLLFLLPVMGLFIVFRVQIIQVIYQRGLFDATSTALTSTALLFYSFGMLGFGLQEVLNKCFYSMQKSVVPMKVSFLTIGINVLCSFSLYQIMGIGGLALSAAIAATVGGLTLLITMRKYNPHVDLKNICVVFVKSLTAAVVSCGAAWLVYFALSSWITGLLTQLAVLSAAGVCCVALYLVLLIVLRVEEITQLKQLLGKKGEENE